MKQGLCIILAAGLVLLSACTATIYGVPEERWEQLSETERIAAMEDYRQRQIVLQQARAERARERAIAEEAARQRAAEEERRLQHRVDAIYRGQGVFGDLLQVTVSDGQIKFSGKHRSYHPLTFRIAQGESKDLTVVGDKGRRQALRVSYQEGSLVLDSRGAKYDQAARFSYNPDWGRGVNFDAVYTKGDAELHGVTVAISVLGSAPPRRQPPQVVVIQQPVAVQPPDPQPPRHREQQQEPPAPPASWKEVVKSQPHSSKPGSAAAIDNDQPRTSPPPREAQKDKPHQNRDRDLAKPNKPGRSIGRNEAGAPELLPPQRILVKFRKGLIEFKGKRQPFTPLEVPLSEGQTQRVTLRTQSGVLTMTLSYRSGVVNVGDGAAPAGFLSGEAFQLGFDRDWAVGKTYHFDTQRNPRLKNLELEVRSLENS